VQISFTVLSLLAAAIVAYEDSRTADSIFYKVLGVPLSSWLLLAGLAFPVIRLGNWLVDFTVRVVEVVATVAQLDNVHYILMGMSHALKCVSFL
jgi:hypothetical protein